MLGIMQNVMVAGQGAPCELFDGARARRLVCAPCPRFLIPRLPTRLRTWRAPPEATTASLPPLYPRRPPPARSGTGGGACARLARQSSTDCRARACGGARRPVLGERGAEREPGLPVLRPEPHPGGLPAPAPRRPDWLLRGGGGNRRGGGDGQLQHVGAGARHTRARCRARCPRVPPRGSARPQVGIAREWRPG